MPNQVKLDSHLARTLLQGRLLVITVIAVAVALNVGMTLVAPYSFRLSLSQIPILLCCVNLYRGSHWARWAIAIVFVCAGLVWTYPSVREAIQRPALRPVIWTEPPRESRRPNYLTPATMAGAICC